MCWKQHFEGGGIQYLTFHVEFLVLRCDTKVVKMLNLYRENHKPSECKKLSGGLSSNRATIAVDYTLLYRLLRAVIASIPSPVGHV